VVQKTTHGSTRAMKRNGNSINLMLKRCKACCNTHNYVCRIRLFQIYTLSLGFQLQGCLLRKRRVNSLSYLSGCSCTCGHPFSFSISFPSWSQVIKKRILITSYKISASLLRFSCSSEVRFLENLSFSPATSQHSVFNKS
jgi:hypothetical protein